MSNRSFAALLWLLTAALAFTSVLVFRAGEPIPGLLGMAAAAVTLAGALRCGGASVATSWWLTAAACFATGVALYHLIGPGTGLLTCLAGLLAVVGAVDSAKEAHRRRSS